MLSRVLKGLDRRTGLSSIVAKMFLHPVPPETTRGKSAWMYVFGMGTLTAFVIQVVTGTALILWYIPSPASAYESLQFITHNLLLGGFLRGMHFFGASAMVVLITAHTLRVFLTASYKFPRELNWLSGVVLLMLTMVMAYSGQLLRWDENGLWTVVVASNFVARVPLVGDGLAEFILAGPVVGGATLSRFFAFHVLIGPGLIVAFVAAHLYLVLYNGISESPKHRPVVDPETYAADYAARMKAEGKPYWPDGIWKEMVMSVAVLVVVILLAAIFGPKPLGAPPDPTLVTVNPQPDWFFRWYYALLTIKPAYMEELVMVYLPIVIGLAMVLLPFFGNRGRRGLIYRPVGVGVAGLLAISITLLTVFGMEPYWVPDFETQPLSAEVLPGDDPLILAGAETFHRRGCQYCHQVMGTGGEYGPDLTDVRKRMSSEILAGRILNGVGEMPAYRDILTTEELDAMLVFFAALAEVE